MQSRLRHSLTCDHHAAMRFASDRASVRALSRAASSCATSSIEHVAQVADDRHVDLDALADRRRVDVDVDDLARVLREVLRVADHAIVEARADREQHVAVLHRQVRFVGAVHARHADVLRVAGREAAEPHQRRRARRAEPLDELAQLARRVREDHAAAGIDHRAFGREQQLHRLLDLAEMALLRRLVRAHLDRHRVVERRAVHRDVLRDVDEHRTGTARARDVERLLDRQREVARRP